MVKYSWLPRRTRIPVFLVQVTLPKLLSALVIGLRAGGSWRVMCGFGNTQHGVFRTFTCFSSYHEEHAFHFLIVWGGGRTAARMWSVCGPPWVTSRSTRVKGVRA